jgi:hypothetical protein
MDSFPIQRDSTRFRSTVRIRSPRRFF